MPGIGIPAVIGNDAARVPLAEENAPHADAGPQRKSLRHRLAAVKFIQHIADIFILQHRHRHQHAPPRIVSDRASASEAVSDLFAGLFKHRYARHHFTSVLDETNSRRRVAGCQRVHKGRRAQVFPHEKVARILQFPRHTVQLQRQVVGRVLGLVSHKMRRLKIDQHIHFPMDENADAGDNENEHGKGQEEPRGEAEYIFLFACCRFLIQPARPPLPASSYEP